MPSPQALRRPADLLRALVRSLAPPPSIDGPGERVLFLLVALSAALALRSIAVSQILFFSAVGLAAVLVLRRRITLQVDRGLVLPLVLFFAWTVAAALVSPAPLVGLSIVKKFSLFLVLFIAPAVLRVPGRLVWSYRAIFVVAAVESAKGIGQFIANPHRDLLNRIHGSMGHWMTYSGLQMLVLILLAAYAVAYGARRWSTLLVGVLLIATLYLSYTRNAWLGAAVGVVTVFALRRPRAILAVLAGLLLLLAAAPEPVRERVRASWDVEDMTTRGRLELAGTSFRLIRDHPWFGVGPKTVNTEAPRYRGSNEFPRWLYQHMHNNFLQMAAERGLPGLLLWVWFMLRLALDARALLRRIPSGSALSPRESEALVAAAGALGVWSGLLVSGLFEYNFGDSEVLLLFLFLMSAPYAWTRSAVEPIPAREAPAGACAPRRT